MRRGTRGTMALGAVLAGLGGAACDHVPASAVTSCETKVAVGAVATDVLFVIDDSGSMGEEQQNLVDNLAGFADLLATSPVRNDLRFGITNTSVTEFNGGTVYVTGPSSCSSQPASCVPTPFPAGALVAVARNGTGAAIPGKLDWTQAAGWGGTRVLAGGTPTFLADFKADVQLGTSGSGKEQPFIAVRRALEASATGGVNAGFLRPGARLAVVFFSDEDDCSDTAGVVPTSTTAGNDYCHTYKSTLDPVADFAAFLDGTLPTTGGEVRRPVVAVVAGYDVATLAPTGCATSYDVPTRYDDLLARIEAAGAGRTLKASICDKSFGPALSRIADLLVPQEVPLDPAPSDPALLAVTVTKADGTVVGCPVRAGSATGDAAIFTPPQAGAPATLGFQGPSCTLRAGDRIDVKIVCAG